MTEKMANPGPAGRTHILVFIFVLRFLVGLEKNFSVACVSCQGVCVTWYIGDLSEQSEEQLQCWRLVLARTV